MRAAARLLSSLIIGFSSCIAMDNPDKGLNWISGTPDEQKTMICAGRFLASPLIRVTPEDYATQNKVTKLVLGGGHIYDPVNVEPIDFQQDGGNALREGYSGNLDYHQNKGFYAVSAEVTQSFGSDWVGDLMNPTHLKNLARDAFWDLIWDDSGHVSVFEAPGLLEQIPTWLKPGGKYIVGIPSMEGREEEKSPSLARQITDRWQKEQCNYSPELTAFIVTQLTKLGFSKVEVRPSPLLKALQSMAGTTSIKTFFDSLGEDVDLQHLQKSALSGVDEFVLVDTIFREASLGLLCIIATR